MRNALWFLFFLSLAVGLAYLGYDAIDREAAAREQITVKRCMGEKPPAWCEHIRVRGGQ